MFSVFSRSNLLMTVCWRRTWRRITTPPTHLCLTQASTWLFPTRETSERATMWAATKPAHTFYLEEHSDQDSLRTSFVQLVHTSSSLLGPNKELWVLPLPHYLRQNISPLKPAIWLTYLHMVSVHCKATAHINIELFWFEVQKSKTDVQSERATKDYFSPQC